MLYFPCSAALLSPTDLGIDAMMQFFHLHQCNKFCRKEWARPGGRPSGNLLVQEGTTMSWPQELHPPGGVPLHAPSMPGRKKLTK